ncbi:MAG TPA: type I secretion system permease/ATPase [Sphingomicrobium sp.]|jgi:ATP-binding cassette subfamily C protein|nr:type I secretion system permease/ATPase [Sphingomicrobium sp.]
MNIAGIHLPPVLAQGVAQCKRHFIAAAGFSLLINILYLAPTLYMLQVYDRVVPTAGKTTLLFITIALGLALGALAMLDMVRTRIFVRVGQRLDAMIAPEILRQMMTTDSAAAGQVMRDFDSIRAALSSAAIGAICDAPWIPVFLAASFLLHFWIGILAIISSIVLITLAWLNQRATAKSSEIASSAMASAHSSQQAAAMHGSTVKALGMTGAMVDRQLGHRRLALANTVRAQFSGGRLSATSRFVRLFMQSLALGVGALLAIAGDISAGAIIASSVLLSRALQPIESLIGAWPMLASARAAARRISRALENTPEQRTYTVLPELKGELEISEIGVRGRDGRPILIGVSFSLTPGTVLGIVGASGSGKTTLGKIIVGALQPTVGTVRVDGARLADWEQDELGAQIGYMPQEPSLFEGSVRDNIARFASAASDIDRKRIDKAVIAAAQEAGVHELILQLPQGYDTHLGLMGAGLSAGQAQRLALARALFGEPPLLVLDEPNAFLDQDGEAALIAAIGNARARGATIILIAHRRGVLECADRLLVLAEGRVKLIGTAGEVVARLSGPPSEGVA